MINRSEPMHGERWTPPNGQRVEDVTEELAAPKIAPKIPPGCYDGTHSGYVLRFCVGERSFACRTKEGIRGTGPVTVTVTEHGAIHFRPSLVERGG